jgi:diacylglycerol kinase family enzyme
VDAHVLGSGEDAADLAAQAAARGATAIGVAGGDGSLGAVAAVAHDRDLPFVCVPFGTRNHFARDAGIDRDDPIGALQAFSGQERSIDIGAVGDRIFLNNVSLGLYASFVHDPSRQTRNRLLALLRMAPAALGRSRRPLALSFDIERRRETRSALVVLVANNDYELETLAELGARKRLDSGLLHAYVVEAGSRRALLALLGHAVLGRATQAESLVERSASAFRLEASRPRVHAAIDGEPVLLESPLEFEVKTRGLRLLLPKERNVP